MLTISSENNQEKESSNSNIISVFNRYWNFIFKQSFITKKKNLGNKFYSSSLSLKFYRVLHAYQGLESKEMKYVAQGNSLYIYKLHETFKH